MLADRGVDQHLSQDAEVDQATADAAVDAAPVDAFTGGLPGLPCANPVDLPPAPHDTFALVATFPGRVSTVSDVDGDGRADVVTLLRKRPGQASSHINMVSTWFSQHNGEWARGRDIISGTVHAAADLDGDDLPDILTEEASREEPPGDESRWHSGITIRSDSHQQAGAEIAFTDYLFAMRSDSDPPARRFVFNGIHEVGLVDLDDDGVAEIVATGPLQVHRRASPDASDWSEVFRDYDDYNNDIYGSSGHFATGDFDGDGAVELATLSQGPQVEYPDGRIVLFRYLRVVEDNGRGEFVLRQRRVPPITRETAMAAGDIDGDGRVDLAIGSEGHPCYGVHVYSAEGDNNYERRWSLMTESPDVALWHFDKVALGDTDGDGDAELALTVGRIISVFEWRDGDFERIFEHALCETCREATVHFGDVDGDGRNELVVTGWDPNVPLEVETGSPYPEGVTVFQRVLSP